MILWVLRAGRNALRLWTILTCQCVMNMALNRLWNLSGSYTFSLPWISGCLDRWWRHCWCSSYFLSFSDNYLPIYASNWSIKHLNISDNFWIWMGFMTSRISFGNQSLMSQSLPPQRHLVVEEVPSANARSSTFQYSLFLSLRLDLYSIFTRQAFRFIAFKSICMENV